MKRPTVLDLFSGAGGMSLGFEAAGFDIAVSVEIDPVHCSVHHFNFPYSRTICGDVRAITSEQIGDALARYGVTDLDVIVGGPPCQGFSLMGKRQIDDPRNDLVYEYLRVVGEIRPKYFVFENVPGIVKGKHSRFIDELITKFTEIGYDLSLPFNVLNAADYNVAQNRNRLILLGSRKDQKKINYPLPVTGKIDSDLFSVESPSIVRSASEAISDLEKQDVFIGKDGGINPERLDYSGYRKDFNFFGGGNFSLCHKRTLKVPLVWNHVGSKHSLKLKRRFEKTAPGSTEPISRFFRLHPARPCNTLRAGTASDKGAYTAPRPMHYSVPRCISVREAARLHSYPDWFRFHQTIWHGFREIGNSVAPLFARELGLQIMVSLECSGERLETYTLEAQDHLLLSANMTGAASYFDVDKNIIPTRKRLVAV